MSEIIWSDEAWEDYLYWQTQDRKTLKRINLLIREIERNGVLKGIGDPEALKGDLHGELTRKTGLFIIWRTDASILRNAVGIMMGNDFSPY